MKEKIAHVLVGIAVLGALVGYLYWDAARKVQWQNKHIAELTKGENPFEIVFRWNEVSLNPFTWQKPYTDKLVCARPSEISMFDEEQLLCVPVMIFLNVDRLDVDELAAMSRHNYWYDLNQDAVARVPTDIFGVPQEEKKYEPMQKSSQDFVIFEWAMKHLGKQPTIGSTATQ